MTLFSRLILFVILVTGCAKYENGPNFSLLTKKQRLTNKWVVEQTFLPGDYSITFDFTAIFEFKDDGDYIEESSNYLIKGAWNFSESKEEIQITNPNLVIFKILRLTNDELWIVDKIANREYHLSPL